MTNVTYKYPYAGYWGEKYKYGCDYAESRVYLNGNYTYPVVMNAALPSVSKLKFEVDVWSDYTSLFNRSWDVYIYNGSSWYEIHTFTMPAYTDTGDTDDRYYANITLDITLSTKYNIKQIVAVPSSRMGSSVTWSMSNDIVEATITETVSDATLTETNYFCGIRPNRHGISEYPSEVSVNIGGSLVKATAVAVNVGGELIYLPRMNIYNFVAPSKESSVIIPFVPVRTGKHTIDAYSEYNEPASNGWATFKVFDESMTEVVDGFAEFRDVELEAGKKYYIILIDEPYYDAIAQRTLKIYNI